MAEEQDISNVYLRIQCIEPNANYRFLIGVKDETVANDLVNRFQFGRSFQRENECECLFSMELIASRDVTAAIDVLLLRHRYRKTFEFYTERNVNRGDRDELYDPDPNLNLVTLFCGQHLDYELNCIFTRVN